MKKTSSTTRGRPRAFERDAALQKALALFWCRGYEGTSVADLVAAMGITPPSLYSAFGSKESLYLEAVERYLDERRQDLQKALEEEKTARSAIARVLTEAAISYTEPDNPPGCMISMGVLACAPEHQAVADRLAAIRTSAVESFEKRLLQAQAEGELSSDINVRNLARFYSAVIQGMSVQARDGATREEVASIAEMAMYNWPGNST
ncbi:TetR/AcrR family transcriptional regulator [Nitrincola sp. MINF-07-Sa-05]|uniref:TetR/AcrR family transcriptional regulator n=1 Tax=Nitrincola salilacus TaxID=3400273 RepID=UPI0039185ABC